MTDFHAALDQQALLQFFEALWHHARDPFWIAKVLDDDFEIVNANEAARALEPRQVPGARFRDLLAGWEGAEEIIEGYRRCVALGSTVVTEQKPVLDGRQRLFETILVPMRDDRGVVTHIWGTSKELTRFVETERELKELNEQLEEKIERRTAELRRAMRELQALSLTDPLTGLANRRRFDEVVVSELARIKRTGGVLSLLMVDIDHFKEYNDRYGHLAGDKCLVAVADAIRSASHRTMDLGVRYGGDEFLVLLPETDSAGARRVAERILASMQASGIPHEHNATDGVVTLSVGVVTSDLISVDTPDDLIVAADDCLYRAKDRGRNQWVASS